MDMELVRTLGCVVLRGNYINDIAESSPSPSQQKPNTPYHVTVITKAELQGFNDERKKKLDQHLSRLSSQKSNRTMTPIDLGVGVHGSVAFNVLFWPLGNDIRRTYRLPRKDFHITLTPKDNHDIEKGVNTVTRCKTLTAEQVDLIVSTCCSLGYQRVDSRDYALEVVMFITRFHIRSLSESAFDQAWRLVFKVSSKAESFGLGLEYLELYPNSIAALLRVAHLCEKSQQAKKAMFMFAQAAQLLLSEHEMVESQHIVRSQCIEAIVRCAEHTEFGPLFLDHEAQDWKNNRPLYTAYEDAFRNPTLRNLIQNEVYKTRGLKDVADLISTLPSVASNQDVFTPFRGELYRLPRLFRWVAPFRLATMSTPRSREDIQALIALGITLIVTLTEEGPLPAEWFENTPCRNLFLPVRNYQAPTNEQVDMFIRTMDDLPIEEAGLVHCGGGKGRAGTFVACYLMARGFGLAPLSSHDGEEYMSMYSADAIKLLRHMRPGSIETIAQETFIKDYCQYLVNGRNDFPVTETLLPESQTSLSLDGKLPDLPSLVVCCGIPGSGKSTFASQLATLGYTIISQDELGSKSACLNALSNALDSKQRVVLDRCNPYVEDREQWLAHAFHPNDALCVHFDVEPEVCIRRADARTNHPTIAPGRAKRIVHSFVKTFVPPTREERFVCIAKVSSKDASSDLLLKLGVCKQDLVLANVVTQPISTVQGTHLASASDVPQKPFIHKFPRTRHLFNLGSASRDDLVLSSSDAQAFLDSSDLSTTTVVEEKVDGANLGISVDSSGAFKVQNRSHYVNSKSHAQFGKLDKWLEDHYEALSTVLDTANSQPGRWILYGEWLFAKHSIHYTNLPDLFLAFDLFDTEAGAFSSRDVLSERVRGTNIHQVGRLEVESLGEQSLLELVRTQQSSYCEGIIEGVYLRRQRDGKTIDRAKIVRSDFIAGDEHWNRRGVVPNTVMGYR